MEDIRNIGFVCESHAPKPGKYKDEPPEKFIGKIVKLGFPCKDPVTGKPSTEHMWLKVHETSLNEKELVGELDNDPIMDYDGIEMFEGRAPVCGDFFNFTVDEIEDVMG